MASSSRVNGGQAISSGSPPATDYALPITDVERVVRSALPAGAAITPEALQLISAFAVEFIAFLSCEAHALAALRARQRESGAAAAARRIPDSAAWAATPLGAVMAAMNIDATAALTGGLVPPNGPAPALHVDGDAIVLAAETLGYTRVADYLRAFRAGRGGSGGVEAAAGSDYLSAEQLSTIPRLVDDGVLPGEAREPAAEEGAMRDL